MTKRSFKKGNLGLSLVSVVRMDVLAREHRSSKSKKKVGEIDIYEYETKGVEGIVSCKEVYDLEGNMVSFYFSNNFDTFEEEILKVEADLKVSTYYIDFENERTLKCQ